jgi:PAS domain-containing protein
LVFSHGFSSPRRVETAQRNRYCGNPYCCNDYCCIVLAVSELASFLSRLRTAALLADDERQCVDANPGACRLLRVSRNQLLARPIDDWLVVVARSQRDAAVRNQRLSPHSGRTVAA